MKKIILPIFLIALWSCEEETPQEIGFISRSSIKKVIEQERLERENITLIKEKTVAYDITGNIVFLKQQIDTLPLLPMVQDTLWDESGDIQSIKTVPGSYQLFIDIK
jgi:hypothetical protein